MSDGLEEIRAPVCSELKEFERRFREVTRSSAPLLNIITRHIVKRKGKQIRPLFVFLSAKLHGEIRESAYTAASMVELLHTATLVHDDVVDHAHERRGFFSINALWKNKIAVLVGDYLLAKGLMVSLQGRQYDMLQVLSDTVQQMSEGELLQIEKARRLDIREDIYFEIVHKKTASLISSCCACGALSSGVPAETLKQMQLFGEKTGMAFQIKDDLLDFGEKDIGKPRGTDIRDKKMTLPLIYLLRKAGSSERRWIINTVKNHPHDNERISRLIRMVHEGGGIELAGQSMLKYRQEALNILSGFPENESRRALEALVRFTTDRNR